MPKMKSKRCAAKRFSFTASGKVKYKKMNLRHILTKKSAKRKRGLRKATIMTGADMKRIKNAMGK